MPITATLVERNQIVADFQKALNDTGIVVPMATTNLFSDPAFRDGAFTSNDAKVRAYAVQKTMNAIDLGVELGAKIYVFWGGARRHRDGRGQRPRDGHQTQPRSHEFFCVNMCLTKVMTLNLLWKPSPNEPRGDIYNATTGNMLAFINTLDHPEMVGRES